MDARVGGGPVEENDAEEYDSEVEREEAAKMRDLRLARKRRISEERRRGSFSCIAVLAGIVTSEGFSLCRDDFFDAAAVGLFCFVLLYVCCAPLELPSLHVYDSMVHIKEKAYKGTQGHLAPFFRYSVGLSFFYVEPFFWLAINVKSATRNASY
jgi:hypothetical protein